MSTFARFPARLQEAIASRLGWSSLRPVQEEAGAVLLDGANAVILAPTAGGKTEAAIFPVLANLMRNFPQGGSVGALYVAPIKALLNNQAERLAAYTEMVGLRRFVWHGDATTSERKRFVDEPAELLMTTPESLEVMLLSGWVPAPKLFAGLQTVIVDEVHAMAGTDRGAHLVSVLERIQWLGGGDVQRVGLSATVGNPDEILRWLSGSSARDGHVVQPHVPPGERSVAVCLRDTIPEIAHTAARAAKGAKSLLFCQSRALTEAIAARMRGQGTDVFVHHSSVSYEERAAAEARFSHGRDACIVCTSTLELGIDVGDLDAVLQANAPSTVSSFLQRMGRTGRRPGQMANTTFLCETPETVLQAVALIELARQRWVEPVEVQSRCWPVLVHQILALCLQLGGITADDLWQRLARVPDFSGIDRAELESLLEHMHGADFLFLADGRYSMGDRAERVYGRKSFMELYAVFSSPEVYRVLTASKREIGSLEQGFVDQLETSASFLLSGRAWIVDDVLHAERVVQVTPAPAGAKPRWGSVIPQLLSFEVCQQIRQVLISEEPYPYLDRRAAAVVEQLRGELGEPLRRTGTGLRVDENGAQWDTYAGGRINQTLKHALALQHPDWKVTADSFGIRVQATSTPGPELMTAIDRLRTQIFWDDPQVQRGLLAGLPAYRLSKFQQALPDQLAFEVVASYLLDVPRTLAWLTQTG